MAPQTPYSAVLGDRDPAAAIRQTADRIRSLVGAWSTADFERSYAPGKWNGRQLLTHLAQAELALGNRARMALTAPDYVAQAFDQDKWVDMESTLGGRDALDAFLALATMNRVLFERLSAADRATAFSHPAYGALTVDWVIHTIAGHQIHHLKHLEQI